jgi:flap endonuclease-1
MKVIADNVPGAVREQDIKAYFGRKVAIDASMCMYQFLVAVRSGGESLTNEDGEVTSHLQGMFYRTLRLMDFGIKPVYVFDGKPPEMKGGELEKRKERRDQAQEGLVAAQAEGNTEDVDKFTRRLVKVTKEHNEEVKKMLRLMGIPVVEAPCEAESLCAELAKKGLVYGVGTEDMDALTFGAPKLLRHLMAPASRNQPVVEIDLAKVLEGLEMSMESFIDLCVLLGCDYTGTIRGVGPMKALEMIREHKNTEEALKHLNQERFTVSDDFKYKAAAQMFTEAEVGDVADVSLKWGAPDEEALVTYLVGEKGFQESRVRGGLERLKKAKEKGTQQRLENFFQIIPSSKKLTADNSKDKKRKGDAKSGVAKKKK